MLLQCLPVPWHWLCVCVRACVCVCVCVWFDAMTIILHSFAVGVRELIYITCPQLRRNGDMGNRGTVQKGDGG